MNSLQKGVLGALLCLSLLTPGSVGAAGLTGGQVTAIVSLLQSFGADTKTINDVQSVLSGKAPNPKATQNWEGVSSTTKPMLPPGQVGKMMCVELKRNLGLGAKGDDVKKLQEMLRDDHSTGFTATPTGVFGPATQKAMKRFQENNGVASSSTGLVGQQTRGFFERNCGRAVENEGDKKGGQMMQANGVGGTVTANTGTTITVKNRDGKLVTVNVTASTSVLVFAAPVAPVATSTASTTATTTPTLPPMPLAPTAGAIVDVVVGKMVMVEGVKNTDGSVTATTIKVGMLPPPPMMAGHNDR